MTGLRYYRILRDLSREELAEQVGCRAETIYLYERVYGAEGRGRSSTWMDFSACLDVPVQELLKTGFPDIVDRKDRRTIRWSKTANTENPITIYHRTHRLTYLELAQRFGRTTRECGRLACVAPLASKKHIKALASYEGISEKAFLRKYSPKTNNKKG